MRVGIIGATGLVGQTILEVIKERALDWDLSLYASPRSAGKELYGQQVKALDEKTLKKGKMDIALLAAGSQVSKEWIPVLKELGVVAIDNSSHFRMDSEVPLVIAEVNPEEVKNHKGIIANPNCSTIQLWVALYPLHQKYPIRRLVISTYQAVSGTGSRAVRELKAQTEALLDGETGLKPQVYPHPIGFNIIPQVENFKDDSGYTTEEQKLINESRKILKREALQISPTCVRVPVINGHSQSVNAEFFVKVEVEEIRKLLTQAPGVVVKDDPLKGEYPLAREVSGRDQVYIGRIRRDPGNHHCLNFWIVGDNLRKGAATNAVQIAELVAAL